MRRGTWLAPDYPQAGERKAGHSAVLGELPWHSWIYSEFTMLPRGINQATSLCRALRPTCLHPRKESLSVQNVCGIATVTQSRAQSPGLLRDTEVQEPIGETLGDPSAGHGALSWEEP